jgi:HEAT repeat protein
MDKWQELIGSANADARQMAVWELKRLDPADALPHLLRLVGDEDWRVRKAAAEVLVETASREVITGLIGCLYDGTNAGKRNTAMECLHRIGESILPEVLRELSGTADYDVKLALISLLADLRSEEALQHLLYLLQREKDTNLLSAAVNSLGHYRRKESVPHLVRLLAYDNPWLQFHCVEALGAVGEPEVLPHILPLYRRPGLQKSVLDAVSQIAHISTLPFLLEVIRAEEKVNLSAVHALTSLYHARLPELVRQRYRRIVLRKVREAFDRTKIPAMSAILNTTPKAEVKKDLLMLFGWIGDPAVLPTLVAYLRHPDFSDCCVHALADFGPDGWDAVMPLLRASEEDEVLIQALRVVRDWTDPRAIPHVLQLLEHPEFPVRLQAIETLSAFRRADLVVYLLALLDDEEPGVQAHAVKVLKEWGDADPGLREATFAKVRHLLASKNPVHRINALQVFVHLKGPDFPDLLLDAGRDPNPLIRQQAIQLMGEYHEERFAGFLVHALSDEEARVRLAAIGALGAARPPDAFEPLLSALEDPDLWIRAAAARVVGLYRHPAALKPLIHHLNADIPPVKIACLEAIAALGEEKALPVVLAQLDHPDMEVKKAALNALGAFPQAEAVAVLHNHTQHADWRLRAAAIQAMGRRPHPAMLVRLHHMLLNDPDEYVRLTVVSVLETLADESSFEPLVRALDFPELIDKIAALFIARRDVYRPKLEAAWGTASQRREEIFSAILEEMRDHA